jgi:hypothetical protein
MSVRLDFVLTYAEAKKIFYEIPCETYGDKFTGTDETGEPETEEMFMMEYLGCGRTSYGIGKNMIPNRIIDSLNRMVRAGLVNPYSGRRVESIDDPRSYFMFLAEKEVYPPVFLMAAELY